MLPPSSLLSLAFSLSSYTFPFFLCIPHSSPSSTASILLPLESCDISLTGITASSPMKYKCLPLSCSFSTSIFPPFAQKKRKKDPDEPPTASQFRGMTRMFVPHRLPFAFHLRDRLSSWPPPSDSFSSLFFSFLTIFPPQFVPKACRWILQSKRKVCFLSCFLICDFLTFSASTPFLPFLTW